MATSVGLMLVELIYCDDCPHAELADSRLRQALHRTRLSDIQIAYDRVPDYQRAQAIRFQGSPTIRINGRDPFASGDQPPSLSCRLYETPEGTQGSPTVDQLIAVLTNAASEA